MKKTLLAAVLTMTSMSAFAVADYQTQINQLRADLNTTYSYVNTKYTEAWGVEDHNNIADIKVNKLDKAVFTADQARQDKQVAQYVQQGTAAYNELKGENTQQNTHINAVQDAAQSANIKADQLSVRADQNDTKLAVTDDRSIHNAVRLDGVEKANTDQDAHINAVQDSAQAANESAERLSGAVQETNAQVAVTDKRSQNNAVRLDGVETVNTQQGERLDQHQSDISALYGETSVQSQRLDISNRNIAANKAALESTNKVVSAHSAQLSNHEQRIGQLEQATSSKFANIDKRFDETDRHIDAGLSGVSAMANIPQVTEYQTFAVGAGVGARGGESAVAVGFSARASQAVVLKASVAGDSQQKWTVGGGISYGW